MSHTKEPWSIGEYGEVIAAGVMLYTVGTRIPMTAGPNKNEAAANMRRIVDCVNACAGMADPAAEIELMRKVTTGKIEESIASTAEIKRLRAEVASLRQQLATCGVVINDLSKEPLL